MGAHPPPLTARRRLSTAGRALQLEAIDSNPRRPPALQLRNMTANLPGARRPGSK